MEWIVVVVLMVILCGMFYIATRPQQTSEAWREWEERLYEPIWKVEYTTEYPAPMVRATPTYSVAPDFALTLKLDAEPVIDYEVIRGDYPTHWYN